MMTPRRTLLAVVMASAVAVVWHQAPLLAQGPTVMMFYGESLKQPIFVSGVDTRPFRDLFTPTKVAAPEIANRSFINVAVFWGSATDPAQNGVRVLTDLKPEMAWQHARLYLPIGTQPAVMVATQMTKMQAQRPPGASAALSFGGPLAPAAVAVLERLGVIKPAGR